MTDYDLRTLGLQPEQLFAILGIQKVQEEYSFGKWKHFKLLCAAMIGMVRSVEWSTAQGEGEGWLDLNGVLWVTRIKIYI